MPSSLALYLRSSKDCILNAAKKNEEPKDRPPTQQEEAYLRLPINKTKNKHLKIKNSISADVISASAWCDRMVAKH